MNTTFFRATTTFFLAVFFILISLNSNAQPGNRANRAGQGPNLRAELEKIPDLTEEQKEEFKSIFEKYREPIQTKRETVKSKKEATEKLMYDESPSSSELESSIRELGNALSDLRISQALQIQEFRAVLTADQRKYFDEQIMPKFLK